jgi:hypothetical protein
LKKSISRFKGTAYGGSFRNDGKLLAAGGEEGIVRVRIKCVSFYLFPRLLLGMCRRLIHCVCATARVHLLYRLRPPLCLPGV